MAHLQRHATAILAGLLCLPFTLATAGGVTVDVGTRKQLFVDDFVISSRQEVRRVLHHPEKMNDGQPVLVMDRPWEKLGTPILGSVLRDGGRFRMWYRGAGGGPKGGVWCYAESVDGLKWTKPKLGLVEQSGSRDNNIYVMGQPQAFTPFVDPNETDPLKRYKSAVNSLRIDTALAHSPDGLTWTLYRDGAAITGRASDTISQVLWDPFAKVYRLYTRTDFGTGGGVGEVRGTRDLVASADADLSDPKSWRTVREWCLGWERGDRDYHRRRQLYSVNGWVYEGVQFALIWALELDDGETMNAYLATTRHDDPWNLQWVYGNRPLIPRGKAGRFDCRWIQPAPNIVTWKGRHWLYYTGLARSHDGRSSPIIDGPAGGIGLATIRLDGFFSLTARDKTGTVITKPLRFSGTRLRINFATSAAGSLRVELQDKHGTPIPGFSLSECHSQTGDQLDRIVSWKSGTDLSKLAGTPVRLRIVLNDADLFAIQFRD